jgi:uncharacterized protein (TIGR03437 family)
VIGISPAARKAGNVYTGSVDVTLCGMNVNIALVSVRFGTGAVANLVSASTTQIAAQVPAGVLGPATVAVPQRAAVW